jgi:hypothetical protein
MCARLIVQRGLRTPTGPFFARFFIGIILGLVAEFAMATKGMSVSVVAPPGNQESNAGKVTTRLPFVSPACPAAAGVSRVVAHAASSNPLRQAQASRAKAPLGGMLADHVSRSRRAGIGRLALACRNMVAR